MLRFFKGFFVKATPPDVTPKPEPVAPYKVEPPTVPEATPALAVDGHGDVHEVKSKQKPAKKAPAKKKPAAMKAPAKPKTTRKPKATK